MKSASFRVGILCPALLVLLCVCPSGGAGADEGPAQGLAGRVLDDATRAPVAGAAVRVGEREAISNAAGRYTLGGVPAGRWVVTARAIGYATSHRTVTVSKGPGTPAVDLALVALPAGGRARFVAPRGDDEGPGTKEAPWRTLGRATGDLKAGDRVYVRAGLYHEHVRVAVRGSATAWTTIAAYPGERVIIDGTGVEASENGLVVTASYLRLEGLEVRNWPGNALWVEESSHVDVTDCTVRDVTYGVGFASGSHHFRVTQVAAHDFDLYAFDVSPSGGAVCHHGRFLGCTARRGRDREQNVDGFAFGHGAQQAFRLERCIVSDVYDGFDVCAREVTLVACLAERCWNSGYKLWQDGVRLENCVAVGSANANVELDWDEQPGTTTLQNCTFVGSQTYNVWVENAGDTLHMVNCLLAAGAGIGLAFEQRSVARYLGDHNLFHSADAERAVVVGYEDEFSLDDLASGAWARFSKQDVHSISAVSAADLFVDIAKCDFRLAAKSPARDCARAEGAPPLDFDDRPRPAGAGCDIGAFETR